MTSIQSSVGLITGIPIAETVKQLMDVEAKPRDVLVQRTEKINEQASAIAELTASVLSLQFTAKKFNAASLFQATKATSSNAALLSASVTGNPKVGNYQFTPIRTAQSHQMLSSGVPSLDAPLSAGSLKLNFGPKLNDGIHLDELNGGEGVQRGEIRITDRRGNSAQVDLRFVQTVDDVLDAINGTQGIDVRASVQGDQIKLTDLTGQTSSNLTVQEVGSGSTAADLGLDGIDVAAISAVGDDIYRLHGGTNLSTLNDGNGIPLNKDLPELKVNFRDGSTPLEINLFQPAAPAGNASGTTQPLDGKIAFSAVDTGPDFENVAISFVDNPGVTQGNETVLYDEVAKTLTFQIDAGRTTAADVISALNDDATASSFFTAATVDGGAGDGLVDVTDTALTAGSTGLATVATTATNANASIRLNANQPGGDFDDVTVQFVADPGVTAGNELVTYDDSDPGNKTLTIRIEEGASTAAQVIDAINADATAGPLFSAENATGSDGSGLVDVADTGVTSGGVQAATAISDPNMADGLVRLTAKEEGGALDNVTLRFVADATVTQGNEVVQYNPTNPNNKILTVRVALGQTTAEDVTNAINQNATTSELFTASTPVGGDGSRVIDTRATAKTIGGAAVEASQPQSLGDVLTMINAQDPDRLQARISADGNRLELIDLTAGGGAFSVESLGNSATAEALGLTGVADDGVITSRRLQAGLKTTLVSSLGGGRGLGELGEISLTDRSGNSANVDLSGAETVEEILDRINAAGLGIEAGINAAGNGIRLRDTTGQFTGNLIAESADATGTAELLGIDHNAPETTIDSGSLNRQFISQQTTLASLNGGKGVSNGSFLIRNSSGTAKIFTINDSKQTIGDVMEMINSDLSLNVEARLNDTGDGISIIDKGNGSIPLNITNVGSSTTGSELHIVGTGEEKMVDGQSRMVVEGSTTVTVDYADGETLNDVIQKINDLDAGFSAGSFNSGSGANPIRLSLSSEVQGAAGRMVIDSTNSNFRFDEIVKAQDALLLFGSAENAAAGVLTSSQTNTFNGVIDGVNLTINGTSNAPINISIDRSHEQLLKAGEEFATQYNALREKLASYTTFNPQNQETGLLFGSNEALRIESQLSSLITTRMVGVGKYQSMQQLGFNFQESGKIEFDSIKMRDAFEADPQAVEDFFLTESRGFAEKAFNLTEQFAGRDTSLLVTRARTLQSRSDQNLERIKQMNERLDRKSEQLLKQFYDLELTIGKLQSNTDAINSIKYINPNGE
ncbi:MAG: flagellar filament capping protein FliD [Pirellulaceae bacterium]